MAFTTLLIFIFSLNSINCCLLCNICFWLSLQHIVWCNISHRTMSARDRPSVRREGPRQFWRLTQYALRAGTNHTTYVWSYVYSYFTMKTRRPKCRVLQTEHFDWLCRCSIVMIEPAFWVFIYVDGLRLSSFSYKLLGFPVTVHCLLDYVGSNFGHKYFLTL